MADLTLGTICYFLSQDYDIDTTLTAETDVPVRQFRIYDDGPVEPKVLYLHRDPIDNTALWKNSYVISPLQAPPIIPKGMRYIHVTEKARQKRTRSFWQRTIDLANSIQSAISSYLHWTIDTERLCTDKAGFSDLLRALEKKTKLVSVLFSKDFRYLAVSDSFEKFNPWLKGSDGSMDADNVRDLLSSSEYHASTKRREPFFCHFGDCGDDNTACFNIIVNDSFEAQLMVRSPTSRREYGQKAITAQLGERISDIFTQYHESETPNAFAADFRNAVKRALFSVSKGADDLEKIITSSNWREGHRYRVHVFSFIEPETEAATQRYYQDRIERLFKGSCSVIVNEHICCVRDLDLETDDSALAHQKLIIFLRENLCRAGTSTDGFGLHNLHFRYEEARYALRLGINSSSMMWHFRFEDYALDYIFERSTERLNRESLLHPAYVKLMHYDEQHETHLLQTARCYMECHYSATHVAEHLFVHRSTVLARLERIEKLTGINWDNWDDRVHLALSFALMRDLPPANIES